MDTLNLSLSIDELNKILNALGKEPYSDVFQLIHNIQTQAHEQLQARQNGQSKAPKDLMEMQAVQKP